MNAHFDDGAAGEMPPIPDNPVNVNTVNGEECMRCDRSWTWADRFRHWLFPHSITEVPKAPPHFKDVLHTAVIVHLDFSERIKLLFSGYAVVETKVVTENLVGGCISNSEFCVTPPYWMLAKPDRESLDAYRRLCNQEQKDPQPGATAVGGT